MTTLASNDPPVNRWESAEFRAPLVGTKLGTPVTVAGYRERPRLSALLDQALADAVRLTFLSAPPGYGKTVALVGWLDSRRLARAWLSLDAADNDLARFVRYLVAALRAVRPAAGSATEGMFGLGANPSPELAGASLLDEVVTSDDPFVLVLDDYQLITAEPIHRLVRFLIERGPPFAHLVLLTREDPPLPLARLRAHRRLVEVRADDLRATSDEASSFLAGAGVSLEPELVERLLQRTEGWIAGLQLAAISLRGRADAGALIKAFGGSQRFVFDYLADEVLGRVDEDLRSFLVRTAIAERFTVELCRALAGREDADALLDRAERANLFLSSRSMPKGAGIAITASSPTTSGPSSARRSDGCFTPAPPTGSSRPVSSRRRSTTPLPPARPTARPAWLSARRGRRSRRGSWQPFSAGSRHYPPTGSRRARSSPLSTHGRSSRRARWQPRCRSPGVISPRRVRAGRPRDGCSSSGRSWRR